MLRSIPFHPNINLSISISVHRDGRVLDSLSIATFRIETFNAYQCRIYEFSRCSYNFHIFRFSQYGKGEVDVYRFMSKHSSDHYVLFCHDPLHVTPRHRCVFMHEVEDESLRKIYHYQQNVPQHYYLLDTLV